MFPLLFQKMNRKMHLSKVKHSKFNESGQLLVFYLVSCMWGTDIILRVRKQSLVHRSKFRGSEM